jgi:hypothetical protein
MLPLQVGPRPLLQQWFETAKVLWLAPLLLHAPQLHWLWTTQDILTVCV